jgi:hypothetical protein
LALIEELISREGSASVREHASQRLNMLRIWRKRTPRLIPVVMAVLGGASLLNARDSADEESIV